MKHRATAPFTLLAFHYFRGSHRESHPDFAPLIERLEKESVCADQGVYILRSQEDAALLDECVDYLQSRQKPYALVRFDPRDELSFQSGYKDDPTAKKLEQWLSDLETKE